MLAEPIDTDDLTAHLEALQASGRYVAEVKYDGFRAIAQVRDGKLMRLEPRARNTDNRAKFPEVERAFENLSARDVVLDGEVGHLDPTGFRMEFNLVQGRASMDALRIRLHQVAFPMTFVAFDVLEVDGASMTDAPWHERREMLESLVPDVPHSPKGERPVRGGLKPSEVSDDIAALYARVCASGGEGIIIKNREAPYEFKRSTFWRKLKTPNHLDDLEVVGLTQGSGTRGETFGSFVLARRDEEGYLRYVCKAGSGLSEADLHRVASAAGVLGTSECPLSEAPALDRPLLTWLRPGIRADVVYERPVKAIGPTPRHPRVRNVTIEA